MQVDTRVLQKHLLLMLKQFHEVCVANNLTYFIVGGTLLGAVRHKGFIPWDDDIDVAMPRDDYNKLKENYERLLPTGLEVKYYENTSKSPMHYMKLIDSNTTLIENEYRNYYEGVYIDVFPIDGTTGVKKEITKRKRKAQIYSSLILNQCYTDGRYGIRKIYGYFAKIFDINKLHNKLEDVITKIPYDSSDIVGSFLGSYGMREFVPKDYFGEPVKYKFEDSEFFGPEKYDAYLKAIYGDYMKLPPVEKQINKHQYYYVSLNESYKKYHDE